MSASDLLLVHTYILDLYTLSIIVTIDEIYNWFACSQMLKNTSLLYISLFAFVLFKCRIQLPL